MLTAKPRRPWFPMLAAVALVALPGAVWGDEAGKLRILLLGDSTTIGSVCRQAEPGGPHLEDVIRMLLAAEPDLPPAEVINQGRDGEFIQRLLSSGRYDREIATLGGVDYVLIRYGLNDVARRERFEENFPKDYAELIGRLRRDFPRAAIVPMTIIPYMSPERDESVNRLIRKVAESEGLPLFDVYTRYRAELTPGPDMLNYRRYPLEKIPEKDRGWVSRYVRDGRVVAMDNRLDARFRDLPGWFADRHPNPAGYHVIGDESARSLARLIREKNRTGAGARSNGPVTRTASPELVSVEKIWDRAPHNAFTDLIRWQGRWYCTFREADAHVGGDGRIRVLESTDGRRWESVALIAEEGIDLRDPKLSITPDDRLMMVAGGSVYRGTKTLAGRRPRVLFSKDGRDWTAPKPVLEEGEWLWRVTWHGGKAYGASYSNRGSKDSDWALKLFASADGVSYDLVTRLDVPGRPNETTLRVLPDGEMIALVRREAGGASGWIGSSRPPYTRWSWAETKHRLGGPNFLRVPDGSMWAAGRGFPDGPKTVLARMTRDRYEPVLTLPSGGDNSYPGLAWHDGLLWITYYSSHEGKAAIYLARVKLPPTAGPTGPRIEPSRDVDSRGRREEGSSG